ncbi:MAG: plastocyanin/azurin family copper-binding protein [Gemmatimonadota bacterium]
MKTFTRYSSLAALVVSATLLTQGCGGGEKKPADTPSVSKEGGEAKEHETKGRTIIVEAITDEKGNYFQPNEIEAHEGDVIRFTLKMGVHNVNFLPDSNARKKGLPATPSEMLQLPGQTYDVPVTFEEGRYYFQCDPHALLGMKGHITVKD